MCIYVCLCVYEGGCSHFEVHSMWVSFSRCVLHAVHRGWVFSVKLKEEEIFPRHKAVHVMRSASD